MVDYLPYLSLLIAVIPLLWFFLLELPKRTANTLTEKDLVYTFDEDICTHAHGHLWRRYICPFQLEEVRGDNNPINYYNICPVCNVIRR